MSGSLDVRMLGFFTQGFAFVRNFDSRMRLLSGCFDSRIRLLSGCFDSRMRLLFGFLKRGLAIVKMRTSLGVSMSAYRDFRMWRCLETKISGCLFTRNLRWARALAISLPFFCLNKKVAHLQSGVCRLEATMFPIPRSLFRSVSGRSF